MSTSPMTKALAVLMGLASAGCALTSKGETLDPHYFTPVTAAGVPAAAAPVARGPLRLGRVHGAASLKEKIAFRPSDYEVGYYEERRWTEKPDVYLRRALSQALFEGGGFAQVSTGAAPTLDVELFAFEEVRGERPFVRIGATMVLRDDEVAAVETTVVVEEPLAPVAGEAATTTLVRAFSRALARTVTRAVDETARGTATLAATGRAPISAR